MSRIPGSIGVNSGNGEWGPRPAYMPPIGFASIATGASMIMAGGAPFWDGAIEVLNRGGATVVNGVAVMPEGDFSRPRNCEEFLKQFAEEETKIRKKGHNHLGEA